MIAYRSTDPAVLVTWRELQDSYEPWHAAADAIEAATGRKVVMNSGLGVDRPFGLRAENRKDLPPPGWRWHQSDPYTLIHVPRRTKDAPATAARELLATVQRLTPQPVRTMEQMYGVPSMIGEGSDSEGISRIFSPGFRVIGEHLWVTYSADPDRVTERERWEPTEWFVRERLSAYYAAKEAADADEKEGL